MKYAIPSPAKEIMNQMAPILLGICSAEQIILGGGTALAARWNHRRSTDIDLFMNYKDFESIRDSLESDLAKASGVLDWRSSKMVVPWKFCRRGLQYFFDIAIVISRKIKKSGLYRTVGFPFGIH